MNEKERAYNYYLKECNNRSIAIDLFDFEHEIDSSLSYSEMLEELHNKFFDVLPSKVEASLNEVNKLKLEAEEQNKQRLLNDQQEYRDNWEILAQSRSIYILGGVRTGKSAFAFGLAKKLQQYKKVYYFNFPCRSLLKEQGFNHLENLNEIAKVTDAVIVLDEIALIMKKYEKRTNDELQKILTLAGQNNLTIIFISQISQLVNKTLESLIDCFVVLDFDYQNLKNGSRCKNMIKDYCTFQPEHFKLNKGEFLFYSRNFPVFQSFTKFELNKEFTAEWSLAYKNKDSGFKEMIKNKIGLIRW